MADPATQRRRLLHLAGAWAFTTAAVVVFAWLTTGSYVRQTLRPLAGEAGTTVRDCQAVPACGPDALTYVNQQLAVLRHTRTLVHASAWTVAILAAVAVAAATVLILRHHSTTAARLLRPVAMIQAAVAAALLVAQGAMLAVGARTLTGTPEAGRMFTAIKAYDSPYTDAGNLYYLAWFLTIGLLAVAVTRTLARHNAPHHGRQERATGAEHQ